MKARLFFTLIFSLFISLSFAQEKKKVSDTLASKKYKYKPKKSFTGQTECFSNTEPIREMFNIFDVFGIDSFKRAV